MERGEQNPTHLSLSEESLSPVANDADEKPPVYLISVVFLSMFQAYAAMQNLQFSLKKYMGVGQEGDLATTFTWAVTMLHIGKLVSRLGHNVLCCCMPPLLRVYMSMAFIIFGNVVPAIFVFAFGEKWIGWVFISYFLIGVGIGVFEATYLALITPLGKPTKSWAIYGIPSGFLTIGVPGFLLLSIGMPVEFMYWYVVACAFGSFFIVYRYTPRETDVQEQKNQSSFFDSLKAWRAWFPQLIPHLVAKMFVNFGMENLFPVIGFTFNGTMVPLWGPESDTLLKKDTFQALQNAFVFVGDTFSRKIPYIPKAMSYSTSMLFVAWGILCPVVGMLLMKFVVGSLAIIAISLAFFGNGLVYAIGTRHMDERVPKEHRLAAYSLWCFMGDISSVVGARSQDLVRGWICDGVHSAYECLVFA